jgi:hypothetical protein
MAKGWLDFRRVPVYALALSLFVTAAAAQGVPPIFIPNPSPSTYPWPPGAGVYAWNYTCPNGVTCAVSVSGAPLCPTAVKSLSIALLNFRTGNFDLPTYFYWFSCSGGQENAFGFTHQVYSFSVEISGMTLQTTGPVP